jgi:hypothetical protein
MCKPSKNLKLCTCSSLEGEDSNTNRVPKNMWKLLVNENQEYIIGETKVQYHRIDKEEQYLLDQLNRFDPFDFKYLPKEGDKLSLSWNDGKEYYFAFHDFQWEVDVSIRLSSSQAPQKPLK